MHIKALDNKNKKNKNGLHLIIDPLSNHLFYIC